jgi:para-aminobenzoate synthetase component I
LVETVHIEPIPYRPALASFARFAETRGSVLLDSARVMDRFGRYSFIAVEPFAFLESDEGGVRLDGVALAGSPFDVLEGVLARYPLTPRDGLPPFQSGAAGYFGYELHRHLEAIPLGRRDAMALPEMALGLYDVVAAYDHRAQSALVMASGHPEPTETGRRARARARARALAARLSEEPLPLPVASHRQPVSVRSNFTRADYEAAVQRVIDYILAGDIFQANLSQRFEADLPEGLSPFALYCVLSRINPAPFAAYLNFAPAIVASSSPERFLELRNGFVETRPIKGTRPRGASEAEDAALGAELKASEKDNAENVMIVDLLRNDLSRVARDGTVTTPELCALEGFATVFHLISTVTAELAPGMGAVDLLRATFPGGSITGAPKIRAMEIIAELEPDRRGPYCGAIGYLGFDGNMDTNIAIRTYAIKDRRVSFQAGGGIVADSDPAAEYDETLAKARALVAALQPGT